MSRLEWMQLPACRNTVESFALKCPVSGEFKYTHTVPQGIHGIEMAKAVDGIFFDEAAFFDSRLSQRSI
jgi:hypothetical protein